MTIRRKFRFVVVLAALTTLLPMFSGVSGAAAILTFSPTDDATVRESSPTTNYGSRISLEVDASSKKDTLLRFEVAGTNGAQVTNATLRLFNIDSSSSGGEFFGAANSNWGESTVTWSSAPAATGQALDTLGSVSPGNWYEVNITSLINGDGPVSLRISSPSSNGADYASTENGNGNAPQLIVTTAEAGGGDTTPPSPPGNLTASAEASLVTLDWLASFDAVGVVEYDIYRDGGIFDSVGSITSYADSTVLPQTTYNYYVIARDAAGNQSDPSATVNVTTPSGDPTIFDVSRNAADYSAVSQNASYTGSLKSVVESALDDLRIAGGGSVLFGAGDFDLGSDHFELNSIVDVTFAGQGMGVTTIRNFTNEAADTEPFDADSSDRLIIRDMTVSAGGSDRETSDALDFDGGDDILIERVEVTDSRGRGIVFDGKDSVASTGGTAERNTVRDCIVSNTPRDGIQLLAANFNRIENCTISGAGEEGIRVHLSSASSPQPLKTSDDNVIINNVIQNSNGNGITVTGGDRNKILGNTITGSGSEGILIFTSSTSVFCDDNIVDDQNAATGNGGYGLKINSSNCRRTVVGDNDFSSNGAGPISDNGTDTIYSSDSTPPSAPSSLTVTSEQATSVTLVWDAASDNVGVTGYDVYRNNAFLGAVGETTTFQDISVAPESTYTYYVVARDASGNLSAPSNIVTATTPPGGGELTFVPTDDATIRQTSPTRNFGSRTSLEVDGSSPKDTLMRFDVSGIGGSSVASAVLRVYVTDRSPVGGNFFIANDSSWNEGTVTWQNSPSAGASLGSLGSVVSGTWYEVDVTAAVSGDGPLSVRVSSTNGNGADYASKEHNSGNAPQLVIVSN